MKIYLAGKMSGLTVAEMNDWRILAENKLRTYGHQALNPVNYYNFETDPSTYTELEVKNFDLHLVKHSDVILVNLNNPDSIGTAIECHEAFENYKIPVIAFADMSNYVKVHPWIKCSVNKHVTTLQDAVEYIDKFYGAIFLK